jgi:hypothetical protein
MLATVVLLLLVVVVIPNVGVSGELLHLPGISVVSMLVMYPHAAACLQAVANLEWCPSGVSA